MTLKTPYIEDSSGCWIWQGARNPQGYGNRYCKRRKRAFGAHRVYWEEAHGPVPEGYELDHLCRVPLCVNPDHLEPVSHATNIQRGKTAKLTPVIVEQVRQAEGSIRKIAKQFGISSSQVSRIRLGRNWSDADTT